MPAPHPARQRAAAANGLTAVANRLLASLPPDEFQRLQPKLKPIKLPLKHVLFKPNRPLSWVYFPLQGVVSLTTTMTDGTIVEIATVGNEGFVGLPVFLGTDSVPAAALAQIPGSAMRLAASDFRRMAPEMATLTSLLHRYAQALFNQVAQSAACNRVHSIEQRCSRWLLMTHDRVASDDFALTQEFLGQMLGVRRASVSLAAGLLQEAGLIRYSRGTIRVVDRPGLEAASCECYRKIRDEYQRLLPAPSNGAPAFLPGVSSAARARR